MSFLPSNSHSSTEALIHQLGEQIKVTEKTLLKHQISVYWQLIDVARKECMEANKVLKCPLCEFADKVTLFKIFKSECIFEGGSLLRHQCPKCDLIFGDQKMLDLSDKALSKEYEWHYQVFAEGDSTTQEMRAFYALSPKKEGVYLNWGAGAWSQTLQRLKEEGWNVFGYEPHGSANSEATFIISNFNELSSMRFDGIFSNNVLEHLRHPVNELALMKSVLVDDGKMSHATPCFEYLYEFTRFHLFFYLGRSKHLLAQKAHLKIEEFIVDGEYMNLIMKKNSL